MAAEQPPLAAETLAGLLQDLLSQTKWPLSLSHRADDPALSGTISVMACTGRTI